MTDTKLDPATLTSEERAIVEEMVTRTATNWGWIGCAQPYGDGITEQFAGWLQEPEWREVYASAFNRILARRALFSPAAEPEPAAQVEMPRWIVDRMRYLAKRSADDGAMGDRDEFNEIADALETFWRTHSQPVGEVVPAYVIKALEAATGTHSHIPLSAAWQQDVRDWLAVRSQYGRKG